MTKLTLFSLLVLSFFNAVAQTPQLTRDAANGSKYLFIPEQDNNVDFRSVSQFRIGPYLTLGNYGYTNNSWIGHNAILNYSAYNGTGSNGDANHFVPNYAVGKALVINLDYATADFTGYTYSWNNNTAAVDLNVFETSWVLGVDRNYFAGKVGIGIYDPSEKLEVNGRFKMTGQPAPRWDGSISAFAFESSRFYAHNSTETMYIGELSNNIKIRGQLALGEIFGSGYKLSIDGKVIAEEVVVKLTENWPDYVFSSNYQLMPLSELEIFLKNYKHLPEIPTAGEVEANGQALGEMNKLLLKKVEELTLYVIQLEKKDKEYLEMMTELKRQVFEMKEETEKLELLIRPNKTD